MPTVSATISVPVAGVVRTATFPLIAQSPGEPLFLNGPVMDDVHQGDLGDCGLDSMMAMIAYRRPDIIRQRLSDNGNGTYTGTYFDAQVYNNPNGTNTWKSVVLDATGLTHSNAPGELWVGLLEKLMIIATGSTQGPVGWYGWEAARMLTGMPQKNLNWNIYSRSVPPQGFIDSLTAGDLICIDTLPTVGNQAFPPNHSLAIYGYDPATNWVEMYQPWGFRAGEYWDKLPDTFGFPNGVANPT